MSDWGKCPNCNEYGFLASHGCKPWFEVRLQDEDDWEPIRAIDHEEAAERWAVKYDNGDYDIVSGRREPIVVVREQGSDDEQTFRVSGEAVPQYSAERLAKAPQSGQGGAR